MNSEYLKKPLIAKTIETSKLPTCSVTSCEMQGWRKTMQDVQIHKQLAEGVHLFAVLDGHGGPEVAHYVSLHLDKELLNQPYFKLKNYPRALINVFRRIDELIDSQRGEDDLRVLNQELASRKGKITSEERVGHRVGTTAVVMIMTKDRYFVANIGDSRAVLCKKGKAVPLSTDHKPDLPSENNRIQRAGGTVTQGRINGSLNLSRAFGDFQYKRYEKGGYEQQCVISLPEITQTVRTSQDEFILMGCDGVWEKYVANSQKMIQVLSELLSKHPEKVAIEKLFVQLTAKEAKDSIGFDNMTALLLSFF